MDEIHPDDIKFGQAFWWANLQTVQGNPAASTFPQSKCGGYEQGRFAVGSREVQASESDKCLIKIFGTLYQRTLVTTNDAAL